MLPRVLPQLLSYSAEFYLFNLFLLQR